MKLSMYQVESARPNPQRFGERLARDAFLEKKSRFNSNQFRTYLFEAMGAYHAGAKWPDILKTFDEKCRSKLQRIDYFNQRTDRYLETLRMYFNSFPKQGVIHIEMGKSFTLKVGKHVINGKVDRFDLRNSNGFRSTDIKTHVPRTWKNKLRWPLVQQALANEMSAPTAEIEVGVHEFDTGMPQYHIFDHVEIEAALEEAVEICDAIQDGMVSFDPED